MYMQSWMIEKLIVCVFAWCMMVIEGILGIEVLDHVIVTKSGVTSLRSLGLHTYTIQFRNRKISSISLKQITVNTNIRIS